MFRRKHQISRPEQGVGTGREDRNVPVGPVDFEYDFRTFGFSDPVALHLLDAFRPVELIQIGKQTFRVFGDFQHPLLHRLADNGMIAALAASVDHFLVGKHRSERRTPVYRNFINVCESLFIELKKNPLRPMVIFFIGGIDLAVPVIAESERLDLTLERLDILFGRDGRMSPGFHCILLGGKPECIPSHRMQNIVAAHPFEPAENIGCGISLRMPDMQSGPARIRKHIQHIEFFFTGNLRCLERFMFVPVFLPFFFNRGKIVFSVFHVQSFL